MTIRALATAFLIFLLSGCASQRSPFQATWYLVDEGAVSGPPKLEMYLAILNRSSELLKVNGVVLNAAEDSRQTGWQLNFSSGRELEPGEILFRPVTDFTRTKPGSTETVVWKCRIPVAVTVLLEPDRRVHADTIGTMPSSVPEGWQSQCAK